MNTQVVSNHVHNLLKLQTENGRTSQFYINKATEAKVFGWQYSLWCVGAIRPLASQVVLGNQRVFMVWSDINLIRIVFDVLCRTYVCW